MTELSSTTARALFETASGDVSVNMYAAIAIILVIVAALVGLGFAWRKFTKHASGRKF